jgi:fatty acid desaturase
LTTLAAGGDVEANDLAAEVRRMVVVAGIGRPDARAALRWLVPWAAGWTVLASALVLVHPLVVRLPLLMVMSFWLVGAGALVHESAHRNVFRSRAANVVLGTVAGILCGVPYAAYRAFHLDHHAYTVTERDPEGLPYVPETRIGYVAIALVTGPAYAVVLAMAIVRTALGRPPSWVRSRPARREVVLAGGVHIIVVLASVAAAIMGLSWLAWGLLFPMTIVLTFWLPFLLTSEHFAGEPGPIVTNTRTVVSNRVVRTMFWNTNLHVEHHLMPNVPSSKMPRLHPLVRDHALVHSGYFAFHRYAFAMVKRRHG